MKHVNFHPDTLEGPREEAWNDWDKRAQKATAAAIARWEKSAGKTPPNLNNKIWADLKKILKDDEFNKKCAYCESKYVTVDHGDAEHFRPKKGIINNDDEGKNLPPETTTDHNGNEIKHPGYFWLAYNWKNLLPACTMCNSSDGKMNQFPIEHDYTYLLKLSEAEVVKLKKKKMAPLASNKWKGFYYPHPDHLDVVEGRLLLHPYRDEPRDHIEFDEFGKVFAKEVDKKVSELGEKSIAVYDLSRHDLVIDRSDKQQDKWRQYLLYSLGEGRNGDSEIDPIEAANIWFDEKLLEWEYSAAIEDYNKYKRQKFSAGIE